MTTTTATELPAHEIHGTGDTTLYLLHGAYGDGRYFANTARVLADAGYRVVVWHAPGYGGTPLPENFSIELAAEAAERLIAATGSQHNIIVGHSMGALIAPMTAKLNPSQVHGIVLSGASLGFQNRTPEDQARYIKERVSPITEEGRTVAEYSPEILAIMMAPGASGPLVDEVRRVVAGMSTPTFVAAIEAITRYNAPPAIAAISVPTLLLAGEFDTACPPAGMRTLAEQIDGSEFHLIENAGHYAFAEQADEFHTHLLSFLTRHFA